MAQAKGAENDVGKVLDAMISGDFEPLAQPENGSYFSDKSATEIRRIADPKELTAKELYNRLLCFAPLKIQLEGVYHPVTSLHPAGQKIRPLSFVSADGVELYPDRLRFVPTRLYFVAHRLKVL